MSFPSKQYFIRHASRGPIFDNSWGHEVSITPQGKTTSRQLGKTLAQLDIRAIWTSPIKRCVQTAEEIKKGIGSDIPIYSSTLLGDPGFMVADPKIAEKTFQTCHLVELMKRTLTQESIPGFYSAKVGCFRMLEKLLKHKEGSQIWVSHDSYISLLTCYLFQLTPSLSLMPNFLEGIEFSFEEEGLFAHFRGLRAKIDAPSLRGR